MAWIERDLIDRWADDLQAVSELLGTEQGDIRPASADALDAQAIVERYIASSDELTAGVRNRQPSEPEVQRAYATIAAGDLEAAVVAFELAARIEPDVVTAGVTIDAMSDEAGEEAVFGVSTSNAAALARELRGIAIRGAATSNPKWHKVVTSSLEKVVETSADRLVALGTSGAVAAVGGSLLDAAGTIGGAAGSLIGKLVDQLKGLKKLAASLVRKALEKVAALFGKETRDAVTEWAKDRVQGLPQTVVGALAGVPKTFTAWEQAAPAMDDLDARLARVEASEASHLDHLSWAKKGTKVLPYLVSAAAAFPAVGIAPAAAVAVALAGWMFWAAWDHSHDVRGIAGA